MEEQIEKCIESLKQKGYDPVSGVRLRASYAAARLYNYPELRRLLMMIAFGTEEEGGQA